MSNNKLREKLLITWDLKRRRVNFHSASQTSVKILSFSGMHVACSLSYAPIIYIYEVFYLVTDLKPSNNGYNRVFQKNFFIQKNVL